MLKTVWRSILKTKSLSAIHIIGLAISIAAATLLFLTAMFELSFDNFHQDSDRIAMIYKSSEPQTGKKNELSMPTPLAPQLKKDIPSIAYITRYANSTITLKNRDKEFSSNNRFVDTDFFQIFDFPFIAGNKHALSDPGNLILTENMAHILFGTTDVIGKQIEVNNGGTWQTATVGAVLKNIPANSSLRFSSLFRYENRPGYQEQTQQWENMNHEVFVKMKSELNKLNFSKETQAFTAQFFKSAIDRLKRDGAKADAEGNYYSFHLLPLSKLHSNDFGTGSSISASFPWVLLLISALILFISASNFVNLSLANSISRRREIGTRKTLGGTTWDIVYQLTLESFLLCFIALLLGLTLVYLFLPQFNAMMNYQLKLLELLNPKNLIIFTAVFLILSLIAGGLPAFSAARTNIILSLKGSDKIKSSRLRSTLTVLQFAISIILIIATIVISSQMNYIAHKPLGFNKTEVISIPIGSGIDKEDALRQMRTILEQQPWVKSVSASDFNIGMGRDGSLSTSIFGFEHQNREIKTNYMRVDYDYLKTLDIKLIAGRDFDKKFTTDSNALIINKAMAAQFGGADQVLDKKIDINGGSTVIGIMDDFNFRDLRTAIEPLTISVNPKVFTVEYIFVRVAAGQVSLTLDKINDIWKKLNPKASIPASYLDENTQNLYQSERTFSKIVISGTGIAIIISCLGLFGLALLSINTRVKEIGIRKVLGSTVSGIIILLSRDFIRLVLIAFLIAAPFAWWTMHNWLQTFAYRIDIQWWMFVLAGGLAITIAWCTIAWQAFRAASTNIVESLKDE